MQTGDLQQQVLHLQPVFCAQLLEGGDPVAPTVLLGERACNGLADTPMGLLQNLSAVGFR